MTMLGSTAYHIIRISTTLLRESWQLYPRRTLAAIAAIVLIVGAISYAKDANKAPAYEQTVAPLMAPAVVTCPEGYQTIYNGGCARMGIQQPSWDCGPGAHVVWSTDQNGNRVPGCIGDHTWTTTP
jgi:hypothetical protein